MLRLLTIPISHYCEKARWALERAGVAYREERHVQGIHRVFARRAGGGSTVPVLVAPDRAIASSREIVVWTDERLEPRVRLFAAGGGDEDPQRAVCDRLDETLGPAGRRLMYVHMLEQREVALRYNNQGVPAWEARTISAGWGAIGRPRVSRRRALRRRRPHVRGDGRRGALPARVRRAPAAAAGARAAHRRACRARACASGGRARDADVRRAPPRARRVSGRAVWWRA
jgi:glutathione S-transferase